MKCNLCNSENLMESSKESRLIPGAKYVACKSCGNVMILTNGVLIPTPQTRDKMPQNIIEDAAIAVSENASLMAVSLTGETLENEMQPSTVKNLVQEYVNKHMDSMEEKSEEYLWDCDDYDCDKDFIDFDDEEENYEYLGIIPESDVNKNISLEAASTLKAEGRDYLVIHPSGTKHVYKNCSKQFLLDIINSIGSKVEVFELKEIELKQEVKYSF